MQDCASSNKIKENKYKILRMSLLLGADDNRQETINNFEDASRDIDAMNDEVYLKEIERRTKQLLVEKQNPILMAQNEEKNKENIKKESNMIQSKLDMKNMSHDGITGGMVWKKELTKPNVTKKGDFELPKQSIFGNEVKTKEQDDFFSKEHKTQKMVDKGIPVIKNNNLNNNAVSAKQEKIKETKIFPDIPLNKEEKIFPDFPEMKNNNSFFDENEFDDLKDYLDDEKKGWF